VAHVVDGDMLDVIAGGKRLRVWILDIDAPEQAQPYGHRSRQSLIALCGGESAQFDGNKQDRNGRVLASVRCNGVDAGAEQVRRGMAWVFVRYAPPQSPLHALEAEARAAGRGLWPTLQPVPPWEWRGRRGLRKCLSHTRKSRAVEGRETTARPSLSVGGQVHFGGGEVKAAIVSTLAQR
jgi:endonuclease YncB( thermonuclease family)